MEERGTIDHFSVAVLGVVTICAYGCWYYSFGVLLDPIKDDTGWSESTLAGSFSAGTVLIGLFSLAGGRLLDRAGHRVVFLVAAASGASGLIIASFATTVAVFVAGAACGLGAFGALGFYPITMTTVVRLNPSDPTRAIAALTIWGALASAIFLPTTAWLVDDLGWRGTTRVLALATASAMAAAAIVLPQPQTDNTAERPSVRSVIGSTWRDPAPRLLTIAVGFGGLAMSTMLVYQVPVMTAAGLSAGTAATMAGLRGFCQLGGRLPLTPLVARLGADHTLLLAFAAMAVGGLLLLGSGTVVIAALFAVVAGFGVGAFSPLQGMKAEQLFDRDNLGATMGIYGSVLLLAGSIGPVLAGILADATGERRWAAVIVIVSSSAAAATVMQLARLPEQKAVLK